MDAQPLAELVRAPPAAACAHQRVLDAGGEEMDCAQIEHGSFSSAGFSLGRNRAHAVV